MQKLSNKIIDLEKEKEAQNFFRPYYKKREDGNQTQPPPQKTASMNLTEIGMENFCTFHQQPHSEKNCPQWINSMTLVMNQMLDSRLAEEDEDEKNENAASTSTKGQEDETMALWNSVSLLDAEEENTQGHKDIRETNVITRSKGVVSDDSLLLPKIRRLQRNIKKKFQDESLADQIPEFTITSQDPKQNRTLPKPNDEM